MTKPAWKVALVSLVLLPFALSCSKKSTTGPSPTPTPTPTQVRSVTLTTDKQQIQPNGVDYATLRATALDSLGKGVAGVTVKFSHTSKFGTNVTFSPDSGLTDSAGQTVTSLRSRQAGVDTITATAASRTATVQINYSSYTLVIDSLSQSVPPGQGTVVRATLKTGGVPVPGDTLNYFVGTSHGSQIYNVPPANVTDDSGHARAAYLAGNTIGFDTVTVTDSKRSLTTQTFISIGGGTPEDTIPASIIIQSVSSYFLMIRGGGGTEKSDIKIQVLNRNGVGIKRAVRVDFTFIQPLGGGEFFAPSSGLTSSTDGTLTTALNTGTRSGTVKFVATVYGTTIRTTPTLVTIRSGPPDPPHFTISTDKCILPGRTGFVGDEATITVYLADIWGNPVPQTAVWFYTNQCMIYPGSAITDETGKCTNTFRTSLPNDSSFATVTAQTRDSTGTMIYKSLRITNYGPIAVFSLSPSPWTITKPGGILFTLTVQDDHGIGIPGDYTFSISPEGYTSPTSAHYGFTVCSPPTQHAFMAVDTIWVGYRGQAFVKADWKDLYNRQQFAVVDTGIIQ